MRWTRKYTKGLEEWQHLLLKCLATFHNVLFSFYIRFMNSESTLNLCSRANVLFETFHTCYEVNNISTFTVHLTFNVIHLIRDCTFERSFKYHVIFANVTLVTASNGILSIVLRVGIF